MVHFLQHGLLWNLPIALFVLKISQEVLVSGKNIKIDESLYMQTHTRIVHATSFGPSFRFLPFLSDLDVFNSDSIRSN